MTIGYFLLSHDQLAAPFGKRANFLIYATCVFMTCGMKLPAGYLSPATALSRYSNLLCMTAGER